MHILVYGANGATGARLVTLALDRGHRVRASDVTLAEGRPQHERLEWVETDILTPAAPARDMEGIDAVLDAVGIAAGPSTVFSPPPLYSEGTRNVLRAMEDGGVSRIVVISATFVETMARGPIWFEAAARLGLASIFAQMAEMEEVLRASSARWTAVRPGWLLVADPSGDYGVFEDVIPEDLIRTRTGDLADFMLRCVEEDLHVRGTPAIAREEPAEMSGPDAVLRDMLG